MHDKITQIMKNAHLFDARDFARQLFQIASFDRFFAFTKDPAMLPKPILFRVSGADRYADLCHKAMDECITLLKQPSLKDYLLSATKPEFYDKILFMLAPEKDPKRALLLLTAGQDDFYPQLPKDSILRRLWDFLLRTGEACDIWYRELHSLRDNLESQTVELSNFPFLHIQKREEAIARFVADYAAWAKGMVMLQLLDFGQRCIKDVSDALIFEAKRIYKALPQEQETEPAAKAEVTLEYVLVHAFEPSTPSTASETDKTCPTYDLSRFTTMHQADFATALAEIKNGRKVSHWIWYIFPMLRGRRGGHNNTTYGIADIGEARAFLADPYLGDNFITICEAILALPSNDIHYILGSSDVDVEKFCASMTLFMLAAKDNPLFSRILDKYYAGKPDEKTLKMLNIL